MEIIEVIVVGFVVGLIAKFLVPGKNEPQGFIWTVIIGIVGSLLANWVGEQLGLYQPDSGIHWIGAIVGSVVLLIIYGFIMRSRRSV